MTYDELRQEAGFDNKDVATIWYSDVTNSKLRPFLNKNSVYMLECENQIVYIGSSTNIPYRLEAHKYKLSFDRVYIGCCGTYKDMLYMESYLIGVAEPVLNFTNYTSKQFKSRSFSYIKEHIDMEGENA